MRPRASQVARIRFVDTEEDVETYMPALDASKTAIGDRQEELARLEGELSADATEAGGGWRRASLPSWRAARGHLQVAQRCTLLCDTTDGTLDGRHQLHLHDGEPAIVSGTVVRWQDSHLPPSGGRYGEQGEVPFLPTPSLSCSYSETCI